MPVSLKDITDEIREIRVVLAPGVSLEVGYKPGVYTPAYIDSLNAAQSSTSAQSALADSLCKVLASWDLVDDAGAPVPLDASVIGGLVPISVFSAIAKAIAEDMNPPLGQAAGSGGL